MVSLVSCFNFIKEGDAKNYVEERDCFTEYLLPANEGRGKVTFSQVCASHSVQRLGGLCMMSLPV